MKTKSRMDQIADIAKMFNCAAEMHAVADVLHEQAVMQMSKITCSITDDYAELTTKVKNLIRRGGAVS